MRKIIFFAVLLIPLFFTLCKKDSSTSNKQPSLLELQNVVGQTQHKFYELAAQTNGDPRKAIMLTKEWVLTQENVQDADVLDSTYIRILMKSGILTTYHFNEIDQNGFSIFRGSKAGSSGTMANLGGHGCGHNIENKKVLIYAAAYSEFYKAGEMQIILDMFSAAGSDFEVTLLKDEQCTVGVINDFENYGLVIIDSHGLPDGFRLGTKIKFSTPPLTEEDLKNDIIQQAGQEVYDMILRGEIGYSSHAGIRSDLSGWYFDIPTISEMELYVTSKYINSCSLWSGTVVLGNMCYSAANKFNRPELYSSPPIRTAFMNRDVISYYGYAKDNDFSDGVTDEFSKQMEDSLVRSFLVDGDSTGVAHLKADKTEFSDFKNNINLKFKHFNDDNYCFGKCGDDYVDSRDGKIYKTVCIGSQVWMAENLRYAVTGSICYEQSIGNCVTYGRLYDWNTVMNGEPATNANPSGVQGICPEGWHVPSLAEWDQLIQHLGGMWLAGGILKSTSLWNSPNTGATDSVSFSALPGGYRDTTGVFKNLGNYGHWWTTRDSSSIHKKWFTVMSSVNATAGFSLIAGGNAMSCRCVKD